MLVLQRKVGERIVINSSIEIAVLSVHGGGVRLGFEAPADVVIHPFGGFIAPDKQCGVLGDERPAVAALGLFAIRVSQPVCRLPRRPGEEVP